MRRLLRRGHMTVGRAGNYERGVGTCRRIKVFSKDACSLGRSFVTQPIDTDRLWISLRAAEATACRGTALLKELSNLLIRKDTLSTSWLNDRQNLRARIESHLEIANNERRKAQHVSPVLVGGACSKAKGDRAA